MFSWGEGSCLQLKDGRTEGGLHSSNIGYDVTDLSAGHNVLAFVKSNGNSFIIRTNESKDGSRVRGKRKFVQHAKRIRAVSCGDKSVALVTEAGDLLCVNTTDSNVPRPVEALRNIPVSQVACGSHHSVVLTKGGQVYTWGQDSNGQLGLTKSSLSSCSPQHLQCLSAIPVVQISAGGEQSFALSFSGGVFGWGRNDCGQLGLGDRMDRHTPTSIQCLKKKKTVDISCGKDHTAILTKTGAVFTFGSGQYGQLGHNSFRDELRPRLVAELFGATVTRIACGRHHTLVLTASKRVYSFGRGEEGQLGPGEESHPSVPLPVHLPQETADGPNIGSIFAGGDRSFAKCSSNEDVHEESSIVCVRNVTQDSLDGLIDKWTSECDSKQWKKIKKEIHRTFSSAACMNRSFLEQRKDEHFQTSSKYSGLNLSLAGIAFEKLVKRDKVLAEVEAALLHLLPSLDKKPEEVEGLRIYLLLFELLHVIQRNKCLQTSTKLTKAVAAALLSLSDASLQVIGNWWSSLSPSMMVKHVEVWKQPLSAILSSFPVPRDSSTRNLLLVLQHLYNANNRIAGFPRIPEKTFGLKINRMFLAEDLLLWRNVKSRVVSAQPLILCDFPFLMSLTLKIWVVDMDAHYSQVVESQDFFFRLFWCLPSDCLKLRLKRATLWEDTFTQLAAAPQSAFKKILLVYFDEDPNVSNVYKKDLFHHVFNDIASTQSGMFLFNDPKTLAWFTSKVTQKDKTFFFFGVLCGLALYSQCIIHLPFPLALFKKLLDIQPTLEDMKEFSSIGRSLQDVLDYEDDVLANLYICFLIHWDGVDVDLDPLNPEKLVTSQNKKEFVDAYVNHVFNTSVEGVFQEFKRGFFQVCEQDLVKMFKPEELQELLVGKDAYDWAKMKQNTVYDGVYRADHPTIQMFWEVFEELTEDQRKDFIWFVTGFRRVPALGMDQIRMKIEAKQVQSNSDDQHYPESLTCYSILVLPLYSTKAIMRDRLIEALIPENVFLM